MRSTMKTVSPNSANLLSMNRNAQKERRSSWTPGPHPWRLLPMAAGIELSVPEHTMHHLRPLQNFGKRFNLCDRVFGTYVQAA